MHLELLPVLVSLHRLGPSLKGRRVLIFVDNNSARDALIKGTSPIADVYATLAQVATVLSLHGVAAWFTRVPSPSNPADAPGDRLTQAISDSSSFVDFMSEYARSLSHPCET